MNRNDLIRALRTYARRRELEFQVDARRGKGSHYRVVVGRRVTTVQANLHPRMVVAILKQLGIDPADLRDGRPSLGSRRRPSGMHGAVAMMENAYPVRLLREDENFVRVEVRDLPEVQTSGATEAEALAMAADAIEVVVAGAMDDGLDVPEPSPPAAGEHLVPLPAVLAAKLVVYRAFRASGMSKSELARRLGVAENEARRILDPSHGTKLDRLDEAARVLGRRLVVAGTTL